MTGFFWGILVGLCLTYWVGYKRKQESLSFMHFGNRTKDIIYIFETKPTYRFRYISPSLDDYLGEGTVAKSYEDAQECFRRIHPDDFMRLHEKVTGQLNYEEPVLQRWRTNEDTYVWFEEYTTPIYKAGEIVAVQGVIRSIETTVQEHERLTHESRHDVLTGVWNRRAFEEALVSVNRERVALFIIDVNDLKQVNDRAGHSAGDDLLKRVACCLQQMTTSVYRIGGDEFAILLESIEYETALQLQETITCQCADMTASVAVGLAWESSPLSLEAMWDAADQEMYQTKRQMKQTSPSGR